MRFQALGDRVLVKRKEEKTTKTGIIIPDNVKEKPLEGEVMSVGEGVEAISVGDTILFGKYSGSDIVIDGEDFIIMLKEDVVGIMKDE